MGQYPVISISLKSMKQADFETAFIVFKKFISKEVCRHDVLLSSDKIYESDKKTLRKLFNAEGEYSDYNTVLKLLADNLKSLYDKNVIVLIDEYDVPLKTAYFNGCYEPMVNLICSVFESVLKTNSSLEFAVLTGCLRISKESIFTGLNNLCIYSVIENAFSQYYGFTEEEVRKLTEYFGIVAKYDEIKNWYDGYQFGETKIYNPWSIDYIVFHKHLCDKQMLFVLRRMPHHLILKSVLFMIGRLLNIGTIN